MSYVLSWSLAFLCQVQFRPKFKQIGCGPLYLSVAGLFSQESQGGSKGVSGSIQSCSLNTAHLSGASYLHLDISRGNTNSLF